MEDHTKKEGKLPSKLSELLSRANASADFGFWGYLGGEIKQADGEKVKATLQVQPHHLNVIGILHGGVYASMADSTMGLAAMLARPDYDVVTTNLNISYLRSLKTGTITINAEIVHATRKTLTAQAQIINEAGELCALATGTFRAIERRTP